MNSIVRLCFTYRGASKVIDDFREAQAVCQSTPGAYELLGPEQVEHAEALLRVHGVLPHHHLSIERDEWRVRRYAIIKSETASHALHKDLYPSEKFVVKHA